MGHDFGAGLILMVLGWIFMPENPFMARIFPLEKARKYAVKSLRECASLANNYDMKIGLENTLTFIKPSELLGPIALRTRRLFYKLLWKNGTAPRMPNNHARKPTTKHSKLSL